MFRIIGTVCILLIKRCCYVLKRVDSVVLLLGVVRFIISRVGLL